MGISSHPESAVAEVLRTCEGTEALQAVPAVREEVRGVVGSLLGRGKDAFVTAAQRVKEMAWPHAVKEIVMEALKKLLVEAVLGGVL